MKKSRLGTVILALLLWLCRPCCAQQEIPSADNLYQIGLRSMQKQELRKAKAALTMFALQYPNDARQGVVRLILAQVYLRESDFFAAKLTLEHVVEKHADAKDPRGIPILPSALTYLGALYSSMRREDDAQRIYTRLQREFPDALDEDGKRFVDSIPEQYRSGSGGSRGRSTSKGSKAPARPVEVDDATEQKIRGELARLIERSQADARKFYSDNPKKRKEYITRKIKIAYKALAIKYKISPEQVQAIFEAGKDKAP